MAYRRNRRSTRSSYGKKRGGLGGIGVNFSLTFLGGLAVGFSNLDEKLPQELVLAAAVAPVTGLGAVKGAAQGIVVGNLLQKYTGGTIGTKSIGSAFGI